MTLPIEELITHLADVNHSLTNSELVELSNLGSEELNILKHCWTSIGAKRRQRIVHCLVELAENNLELNFDGIFKLCLQDKDAEVISQAIEGLWENEEPSLINPLISLLREASSEKVQAAAVTALGKFVILAEDKKLRVAHVTNLQEALITALHDKKRSVEVTRRTIEAVAPLNLTEVKTAIMDAYRSHDPELRISAIHAMGKNCDSSWWPLLQEKLTSDDIEERYEAAGACGEIEEMAAVPDLIGLVSDPDIDVRLAAIQALGKIGGPQAKECLRDCLNDSNDVIRQTAMQALGEIAENENPLSLALGRNGTTNDKK